jgi:hypothetical protein
MLRLGPRATAIFDSRSRQPLWCELRPSRAGRRNTASSHAVQVASSAVAERWARSARSECFDHLIVFSEANWCRVLSTARRARSISKHVERSPRNLCSAGYTTFTGLLHDQFLHPTAGARAKRPMISVCYFCDGADGGCRIIFVLQYLTRRCGRIRTHCGLTPG